MRQVQRCDTKNCRHKGIVLISVPTATTIERGKGPELRDLKVCLCGACANIFLYGENPQEMFEQGYGVQNARILFIGHDTHIVNERKG